MLVKYIKSENEGYWLFLSDIEKPNQNNNTFTIKIPKSNKLSNIEWDNIRAHIQEVTDSKLASQRRRELRSSSN